MGEVSRQRVEPRLLQRCLAELSNQRRPRGGRVQAGPWEPIPNVLVSPDLSKTEALQEAQALLPLLRTLASLQGLDVLAAITDQLSRPLGPLQNTTSDEAKSVHLAGDVRLAVGQIVIEVDYEGTLVHIWITHEPDWIQPDDSRLWSFLHRCERKGARPLVIARKIAVVTFPLFKILQCQGLQYYSTFVREDSIAEATALREQVGWSHVRSVNELQTLPINGQVSNALARLCGEKENPHVKKAIREAVARDFHRSTVTPKALLAWWTDAELEISRGMVQTLERWSAWQLEAQELEKVSDKNPEDPQAQGQSTLF
jgi:hypothetical protein